MFKTALGRFRLIALIEGISYLFLLLIAMPLKYFADTPLAVTIAGMTHGVLFCLYIVALIHVTLVNKWSWLRVLTALIVSIIPFANFVFDRRLRDEQNLMTKKPVRI